jgi:hypothetical protein
VAVRRGSVSWHVLISENSDPLVLKDDLVEVGVGLGGSRLIESVLNVD